MYMYPKGAHCMKMFFFEIFEKLKLAKVIIKAMCHVTKFLLIFCNNLNPHENRYRLEILGN